MQKNKRIIISGILFLFLAGTMIPASAHTHCSSSLDIEEQQAFDRCILYVEQAAQDATSFDEFVLNLKKLCQQDDFSKFPVINEFLKKLFLWILRHNRFVIAGNEIADMFNQACPNRLSTARYLVVSHGSYNRLRPQKENEVKLLKQGVIFWHYSDQTRFIHGKTLIIEKNPFEIKKRVVGEQIGFMIGYKGIYLDIESRLTGMSYVFLMGRAQRVRALDITPFSK